jgi:hypothetical protein
MSKIEEMAKKHVEERRDLDIGRANCQFDCFDMEDAVKYGANAVLKEIENILSLEYNTMATVDLIEEQVKELKGEEV